MKKIGEIGYGKKETKSPFDNLIGKTVIMDSADFENKPINLTIDRIICAYNAPYYFFGGSHTDDKYYWLMLDTKKAHTLSNNN